MNARLPGRNTHSNLLRLIFLIGPDMKEVGHRAYPMDCLITRGTQCPFTPGNWQPDTIYGSNPIIRTCRGFFITSFPQLASLCHLATPKISPFAAHRPEPFFNFTVSDCKITGCAPGQTRYTTLKVGPQRSIPFSAFSSKTNPSLSKKIQYHKTASFEALAGAHYTAISNTRIVILWYSSDHRPLAA